MNLENSIDALNTLIQINNDRIEGYKTASEETEDTDLKILFSELSKTSQTCNAALATEVKSLGGTPTEGTKTTGKIYRVWMDFKALVTGKSRSAILNSCEYGEDVAVSTYEDVLDDHSEDLTTVQQAMLKKQHLLIKADHDKVKGMRELVAA
jgi:uncharacterized protein (TIGR02284 family)